MFSSVLFSVRVLLSRAVGSVALGVVLACVAFVGFDSAAYANETSYDDGIDSDTDYDIDKSNSHEKNIEELIVTATRSGSLIDIARSVSIIDREDIRASGASSIQDLLRTQANIALTSFSGNGKFTSVDIRGSGDTAVSNVLVLIDGVKINAPDLNGAEYAIIPVAQIERVEIVRGANAVRFGDGASQGVINILTKSTVTDSTFSINTVAKSFSGRDTSVNASINGEQHRFSVSYTNQFSEGYRDHNQFSADTLLAAYEFRNDNKFSSKIIGRGHVHDYELPGPLSYNALRSGQVSATSSISGKQQGDNDDRSVVWTNKWTPSPSLQLSSVSYYRDREDNFRASEDPDLDQSKLRSYGADLNSKISFKPAHMEWNSGLSFSDARYSRSNGGIDKVNRILNAGDVEGYAAFSSLAFSPIKLITVEAGARLDKKKSLFSRTALTEFPDTNSPDCVIDPLFDVLLCPNILQDQELESRENNWSNNALEAGFVFKLSENSRVYASAAKTFRTPNVDELALSPNSLEPQKANRYEFGYKSNGQNLSTAIGLFHSRTVDEIVFRIDENINAEEPISRRGVELTLKWFSDHGLSLAYQGGYIHAKDDLDRLIPHVTKHNHSFNINYIIAGWNLNVTAIHTAKRLDGNDENNLLYKQENYRIDAYTLLNARVEYSLHYGDSTLSTFFGVNNLANEKYITASYSQTVYPGNGREAFIGINYAI